MISADHSRERVAVQSDRSLGPADPVDADRLGLLLRRCAAAAARPSEVAYALCALGVATFWPTFVGLARVWRESADYGHGVLIAAISVGWLAVLRARVDSSVVRPMPLALPALALCVAAWVVAYRSNSLIGQEMVMPAAIVLAVLAALGVGAARRVLPPIAYLYFAVPIWDQLLPLLQTMTTHVAEGVLRLLQVPTVVDSYLVTIPEGQFKIAEGCSGKRYLLVALAFAALVAAARDLRPARAAILLAASVAGALVTNWLRVIVIIYAGHVTNMEHYLVAVEHITFGWAVFVPLLLAVVLIARRLHPGSARPQSDVATREAGAGSPAWLLPAFCLAVPMLAVATQPDSSGSARLGQLPVLFDTWHGPVPVDPTWQPHYVAPADERRAAYMSSAGAIEVYVNLYAAQTQGHELIFFRNSVAPPGRFSVLRALPPQGELAALIAADAAGDHWVIAQTYSVHGRLLRTDALAQLYYGLNAVWRPVPSGTIALAAVCHPDCAQAEARLRRFWLDNGSTLATLIPRTL